MIEALRRRLNSLLTRGKLTSATPNPVRTLVTLSGLFGETQQQIELMLPYAMSALPKGGEDLILLQIGGSRAHLVALFADASGLRITDLQPGEFGWRDVNAQQIVFRQDHLEITTTKKVIGTASEWDLTGPLKVNGTITATDNITSTGGDVRDKVRRMADDRSLYDAHVHPGVQSGSSNTGPPNQVE